MSRYLDRLKALADSPCDGTAKTAKTPEIDFTQFSQSQQGTIRPPSGAESAYVGSDLWRKIGEFYDACQESAFANPGAWSELKGLIHAYDEAASQGETQRAAWAKTHGQRMRELASRLDRADKVLEGKDLYEVARRVFGE